jgi:hypothetical protein
MKRGYKVSMGGSFFAGSRSGGNAQRKNGRGNQQIDLDTDDEDNLQPQPMNRTPNHNNNNNNAKNNQGC